MDLFETLNTCCGRIEYVHVLLMELELIMLELWPVELSHFAQLFALFGYGVCVTNLSQYSVDDFYLLQIFLIFILRTY